VKPEHQLLVLTPPARVVEAAERLGLDRPLENLTDEALAAGRVGDDEPTGHRNVFLRDGIVVRVRRARSPFSGRPAWLPVSVGRSH
jgi:hypothetical protein